MAEGAGYKAFSKNVKWYYKMSATQPALPADLAAADTIAAVANEVKHVTNDPAIPSGATTDAETRYVTSREAGATAETYVEDIDGPPTTGDALSFELTFNLDLQNTVHKALAEADNDTYATVIADIQTTAGTTGRKQAANSPEGTLVACVVKHGAATLSPVASATFVNGTVSFRLADADSRKLFHYGPP